MKDVEVKVVALVLAAVGIGICWYKVAGLGFPLQPTGETESWTVEARLKFRADGGPAKVEFDIPRDPPGFMVLDEDFVSSEYGLATEEDRARRKALWAVRRARGNQVLYYRLQLLPDPEAGVAQDGVRPAFPSKPEYPELEGLAIEALLEHVRAESADVASFTRELLQRLNDPAPEENVLLLREGMDDPRAWVRKIMYVLAGARIPSRMAHLLQLKDGLRHGELTPWLEVHNGQQWIPFNPYSGERGYPPQGLLWYRGERPMVSVDGGRAVEVEFSAARQTQALAAVAEQRAKAAGSALVEYSLFSLPVQTQNVYRVILLLPIGAFIIVLLRNVVGIRTFGTFMPVLIALAFRETQLVWGVILFTLLVTLALAVRLYLETLKLLLVPRLSAVLIIVVLLMAGVSILSHKMGMERGLSIALFPMVILTMTIERMSLVWEEEGPREAMRQGLGTLAVAVVGYAAMTNPRLGYLVFTFPELLLVVLAATLLLGRYTGYRLLELWRFRALLREGPGR